MQTFLLRFTIQLNFRPKGKQSWSLLNAQWNNFLDYETQTKYIHVKFLALLIKPLRICNSSVRQTDRPTDSRGFVFLTFFLFQKIPQKCFSIIT